MICPRFIDINKLLDARIFGIFAFFGVLIILVVFFKLVGGGKEVSSLKLCINTVYPARISPFFLFEPIVGA
jgi:hypothetical protein